MRAVKLFDEKDLFLFEHIPEITVILTRDGEVIFYNKLALDFFNIDDNGENVFPFTSINDREHLLSCLEAGQDTEIMNNEVQVRVAGEDKWLTFKHSPLKLLEKEDAYILTFSEITSYKNMNSLLKIKKQIIKSIVKGASLSYALNKLSFLVEELLQKKFHTGVMLMDESREYLHVTASPSLPREFLNFIDGVRITPNLGSCGPAIHQNQMFICPDIASHPNWDGFSQIAIQNNILSSWSFPITLDKEPIGTFTMYHFKPYSPTDFEIEVLETCSYLIGLAVERDRSRKLAVSYAEQSLRTLIDSIPDIVIFKSKRGNWIETNQALKDKLSTGDTCLLDKNEDQLITMFPENHLFFKAIKTLTDEKTQTSQKEVIIYRRGKRYFYDFKTAPIPNEKGFLLIGRDITEKTLMKEKLLIIKGELENTLKLQKTITVKYKKFNNTFIVTMAKGEGLQSFGLSEEKMLGKTVEEIFPNKLLPNIRDFLDRAWAGEALSYEDNLDGVFFIAHVKPVFKDGAVTEIILSGMDITGSKALEQKLRESEKRYHSLVKNSLDAVYFQNSDGIILEANRAFERITGYKTKEILYQSFFKLTNKKNFEENRYHFRKVIDGIPQRYETTLTMKNGKEAYVSVTKIPFYEKGMVTGVFGIAKDITHEKKIVEELSSAKDQLESFIENTSDSIVIMELNGSILRVNRAFERAFGWSKLEAEGQDITIIQRGLNHELGEILKRVYAGEKISDLETTCYHKLGYPLDISLTFGPIRNKRGSVIALSCIIRDVTDRKKTEDLFRKAEQLSVIGQLAAGVAHEIRNPLTSLSGFLQLINESVDQSDYIDVMHDELKRIEFITNEFLSLAKPHVKVFEKKDITLIIEGVVKIAEIQGVLKNVVITTEFEADIPLIHCDENQLKQVFLNILKNAIESMENGGAVSITTKTTDNWLQIDFKDTGCGIPTERLRHLGEPFYSTKEKGTGLGLMISKKIISEHNGQLLIDSKEGKGTTISVLVPLAEQL
jgi:PAS domain S-box-containing protein